MVKAKRDEARDVVEPESVRFALSSGPWLDKHWYEKQFEKTQSVLGVTSLFNLQTQKWATDLSL